MKRLREQTPLEKRAKWRRVIYYSLFAIFLVSLLFLIPWFVFSASRKNPPYRIVPENPPDAEFIFPIDSTIDVIDENPDFSTPLVDVLRHFQPSFPQLEKALGEEGQLLYWQATEDEPSRWLVFLPLKKPQKVFVVFLRNQLGESGLIQFAGSKLGEQGDLDLPMGEISSKGVVISSSVSELEYQLVPNRVNNDAASPQAFFSSSSGYFPPFLKGLWPEQLFDDVSEWDEVASFTITWQESDSISVYLEFEPELDRDPLMMEQSWFHPLASKDMIADNE